MTSISLLVFTHFLFFSCPYQCTSIFAPILLLTTLSNDVQARSCWLANVEFIGGLSDLSTWETKAINLSPIPSCMCLLIADIQARCWQKLKDASWREIKTVVDNCFQKFLIVIITFWRLGLCMKFFLSSCLPPPSVSLIWHLLIHLLSSPSPSSPPLPPSSRRTVRDTHVLHGYTRFVSISLWLPPL